MSDVYLNAFGPDQPETQVSPEPAEPLDWLSSFASGFKLENDVLNALDYFSAPRYDVDLNFDPVKAIQDKGLMDYKDDLVSSVSQGEFDYRVQKLRDEQALRMDYARSGYAGILGGIAGGFFSPTMFIPLIGPEVKAGQSVFKAARSALLYGTIGGVLQEVPLQLNQMDRTEEESFTSVLGQAVLSGILGSLAHGLSNKELARMSRDMVDEPGSRAIPKLGSEGGSEVRFKFEAPEPPSGHVRVFELPTKEGEAPRFTTKIEDLVSEGLSKGRYVDMPETQFKELLKSSEAPKIKAGVPETKLVNAPEFKNEARIVEETVTKTLNEAEVAKYESDNGFGSSSAGAKETFDPKGGTYKNTLTKVLDPIFDRVAPTNRMINQPGTKEKWESVRWAAWQMDNGGVMGEVNLRGEATAPGGTIKDRADSHYGKFYKAHEAYVKAYQKYVFSGRPPSVAPGIQAALRAKGLNKMTRKEFAVEVGRALTDDTADVVAPEVREAANAIRTHVFNPIFKLAEEAGIYKNVDTEIKGDKSYFARMIDAAKASRYRIRLEKELAAHYHQILLNEFDTAFAKEVARGKGVEQAIADINLPGDIAKQLRDKMLADLDKAELNRAPEDLLLEERIKDRMQILKDYLSLRKEYKKNRSLDRRPIEEKLAGPPYEKEIKELRQGIKDLKKQYGPPAVEFKAMKSATKARLRALNRNLEVLAEKRSVKYEQAYQLEENGLETLSRMSNKIATLKIERARLSDAEFLPKLRALHDQFAKEGAKFDKAEEKLYALKEDLANTDEALKTELAQDVRAAKLTDLADKIGEAESLDRAGWRQVIDELELSVRQRASDINKRRALRQEKLFEEIKGLDPARVKARVDELAGKSRTRREAWMERWRMDKGLDNATGVFHGDAPEFMNHAKQLARDTADAMANTPDKLPYNDLIAGPRGSEIARMLTIPTEKIAFVLEMDAEKVVRAYIHSMAPDIEIARAFGDVRGSRPLEYMLAERDKKLAQLEKAVGKDGKPLTQKALENRTTQIEDEYKSFYRMFTAQLSRLRHTRGIPDNPADFTHRAGVVVRNLNVLRYMGATLFSSIPDVSRLVMKHGLTRVFRDLFIPLITNFKELRLNSREAYLAGEALDVILHSRKNALYDVMTEPTGLTSFERGIQWATDKIGIIGLFDVWNQELKRAAAVLDTAHFMDAMKTVMEGKGPMGLKEAEVYMAKFNLEGQHIERIWKQVTQQPGGGDRVRGLWWPNTEAWADEEAKTLFRQALSSNLKSTIVTPGLERPLISDANLGFRLVFQFKSFGLSSLTRSLQAGLQQGDMAALNGALLSLALGALSYYTWAVAVGGDTLEEANQFDPAKYADEAIARSGLLAVGQDAWDVAQQLPRVRDYATFSGKQVAQRRGVSLIELLAGPSFDAAQRAGNIILNLDEPTATTVHSARTLLPFQNLFYIRQALDKVEAWLVETGQLPERRN